MCCSEFGDVLRQAVALSLLGWDHSDLKRAIAYWEEALPLYRQVGNQRAVANNLGRIGLFLVKEGNIESGQKYLDESNLLYQQLNITTGRDSLTGAYGQIALMRGDYEQARAYFQENARINKEIGSRMDYLWADLSLGYVALHEGNFTEARQIFSESAQEFWKDKYIIGVIFTLECQANLYIAFGKAKFTARLIGWADATREKIGNTRPLLEQAVVDRNVAAVIASIGKAAFEDAYNRGCTMTIDEAVAFALEDG